MKTIKAGTFPGEVREYVVNDNATVADVLGMAGISVGPEMDIQADGRVVSAGESVANMNIIVVTKRLKGAAA